MIKLGAELDAIPSVWTVRFNEIGSWSFVAGKEEQEEADFAFLAPLPKANDKKVDVPHSLNGPAQQQTDTGKWLGQKPPRSVSLDSDWHLQNKKTRFLDAQPVAASTSSRRVDIEQAFIGNLTLTNPRHLTLLGCLRNAQDPRLP